MEPIILNIIIIISYGCNIERKNQLKCGKLFQSIYSNEITIYFILYVIWIFHATKRYRFLANAWKPEKIEPNEFSFVWMSYSNQYAMDMTGFNKWMNYLLFPILFNIIYFFGWLGLFHVEHDDSILMVLSWYLKDESSNFWYTEQFLMNIKCELCFCIDMRIKRWFLRPMHVKAKHHVYRKIIYLKRTSNTLFSISYTVVCNYSSANTRDQRYIQRWPVAKDRFVDWELIKK